MQEVDVTKVKEMPKGVVNSCYEGALEKQKAEGYIVPERAIGLEATLTFRSVPSRDRILRASCPSHKRLYRSLE
ncbi:hypothetical protein BC827DRAFT_1227701 [Russula dissimulans]|nr:hypothetical protein BC827DRAFT_1227701 [Russula dissimulans]